MQEHNEMKDKKREKRDESNYENKAKNLSG
jgi:hypothetical protein